MLSSSPPSAPLFADTVLDPLSPHRLGSLVPAIPFTPPNPAKEYLRFHTQKTWPIEDPNSKERSVRPAPASSRHPPLSPVPTQKLTPVYPFRFIGTVSTVVTLSAPVVRLPFDSPAARHKFLLLTTPEYYHPFRPAATDPYHQIRYSFAYTDPSSPVYPEGSPATFLPPAVLLPPKNGRTSRRMLHRFPAPRVGGWTPGGFGLGGGRGAEYDTRFFAKLADRKGEDLDGWVSIKCGLFPFQLQNKKWCEDTLRRLVNEANVSSHTLLYV